ncbi:MAG: tryptophan synthase subunit beta [Methanocalculus sp. MSAO_Arc1]|uniref:tryptophan synthase subunit beta n=1 Tax=Methanocalculus TaxID=71151 RepID=UPI000FF4A123|nr:MULTISPECIES: tryptophan synthase subunit beta [unclassified Methanocalculus]MCP1661672.1 tryptophan synthase beta chain [Methanocalculus sp. AMF5]RQD81416.1 MAG: tryptophan synthase subunit beta [Methanocalculus sp. MSAO_Arc1]
MTPGRFGIYGGCYAPEILLSPLEDLCLSYAAFREDEQAMDELSLLLSRYAGRETPLYRCRNLGKETGVSICLKREDLLHGGAHKINNTLGQALLAEKSGKKRLIAETGAGQHGVATAMAGAVLGLQVEVFMGSLDMQRQAQNVARMELLGATVTPVSTGSGTLSDAVDEALRNWAATAQDSHYLIGSCVGPHPFPEIVRDFQSVIGRELSIQSVSQHGRLPDAVVACVGGGSNAIGTFSPLINDSVRLVGAEAGGVGSDPGSHGASLCSGTPGILHGAFTSVLQDDEGQISFTHSISAGLDYPGVGPEHAFLRDAGRVEYMTVSDSEAIAAFRLLSRTEGIIPALESAHAVAAALRLADDMESGSMIAVTLSGRGDKDLATVLEAGL